MAGGASETLDIASDMQKRSAGDSTVMSNVFSRLASRQHTAAAAAAMKSIKWSDKQFFFDMDGSDFWFFLRENFRGPPSFSLLGKFPIVSVQVATVISVLRNETGLR